jgi:hypothetical protein
MSAVFETVLQITDRIIREREKVGFRQYMDGRLLLMSFNIFGESPQRYRIYKRIQIQTGAFRRTPFNKKEIALLQKYGWELENSPSRAIHNLMDH